MFHGGLGSGLDAPPLPRGVPETRKVILIDHTPKPTQRASEICIPISDSFRESSLQLVPPRTDCDGLRQYSRLRDQVVANSVPDTQPDCPLWTHPYVIV